jgi:hypothetical protein
MKNHETFTTKGTKYHEGFGTSFSCVNLSDLCGSRFRRFSISLLDRAYRLPTNPRTDSISLAES